VEEGAEHAIIKKGPGAPKQPHEEIDHWPDGRKNYPGDGSDPLQKAKPKEKPHIEDKEGGDNEPAKNGKDEQQIKETELQLKQQKVISTVRDKIKRFKFKSAGKTGLAKNCIEFAKDFMEKAGARLEKEGAIVTRHTIELPMNEGLIGSVKEQIASNDYMNLLLLLWIM
jgi:hypothetical protein